jgi:Cupin domain
MHVLMTPPGTRGTPHLHEGHETAIFIADGEVEVWHGPGLTLRTVLRAGDFLCVTPGTPDWRSASVGTSRCSVTVSTPAPSARPHKPDNSKKRLARPARFLDGGQKGPNPSGIGVLSSVISGSGPASWSGAAGM